MAPFSCVGAVGSLIFRRALTKVTPLAFGTRFSSNLGGIFQAGEGVLVPSKGPGVPFRLLRPLQHGWGPFPVKNGAQEFEVPYIQLALPRGPQKNPYAVCPKERAQELRPDSTARRNTVVPDIVLYLCSCG